MDILLLKLGLLFRRERLYALNLVLTLILLPSILHLIESYHNQTILEFRAGLILTSILA